MKKTVSALSVSATAVVLSLMCGAPAASASPAVEGGDVAVQNGGNTGQVCDVPFGTTKVESPTPEQLVVTAEPGFVIDKICVKAGSDNQGDGVEWIDGNGATTITVSHSSGKKVSHFVAYFKPTDVTPPPPVDQPIYGPLPVPVFQDLCGTENDRGILPTGYDIPGLSYVFLDSDTILAVATTGHYIAPGVIAEWNHEFNTDPCPPPVDGFIFEQPLAPTLCDGEVQLPADTEKYYYGMDGFTVYVIEKDGLLFQQDIITSWPIASLTDVCVGEEPPVVVDPPVDVPPVDVPPVDVPPVVEQPPAVDVKMPADEVPLSVVPAAVEGVTDVDHVVDAGFFDSETTTEPLAETGVSGVQVATALGILALVAGVVSVVSVRRRLGFSGN